MKVAKQHNGAAPAKGAQRGSRKTNARSGFALMISLVLMAFMTLLLLALGSLTQVEMQSSTAQQSVEAARSNARLAMLVALGQLQTAAGPDRRVTATGELIGEPGRTYWTGVWRTSDGSFDSWLVSAGGTEQDEGEVTFLEAVYPDAADASLRVSVPKIAVGQGADLAGHYAYWIADEGVKAKVNVVDPFHSQPDTIKDGDGNDVANPAKAKRDQYRQLTAQDAGGALLFGAANVTDGIDFADSAARAQLANVYALEQIPLVVTPAEGDGAGDSPLNRQNLMHDVTVYGMGVLANVRNGGLKKDLTAAFENGLPRPAEFYSADSSDPVAVWWNRLSDYYSKAGASQLDISVGDGTQGGYFPVPVKVNQYLALLRTPVAQPIATASELAGNRMHVGLFVEVSLHNPYNVPLVLPDGFIIEVILPSDEKPGGGSGGGARRIQVASTIGRDGLERDPADLEDSLLHAAGGLRNFNQQFQLAQSVTFDPGQTLIFSTQPDGGYLDITAEPDGARLPILKPGIQRYLPGTYKALSLPMVYRTIAVHEPLPLGAGDVFDGFVSFTGATAGESFDQADRAQLRLFYGSGGMDELYAHVRFGVPSGSGSDVEWFAGFHNPLSQLALTFDYDKDLAPGLPRVRDVSSLSEPTGGLVLSHEIIMPRRAGSDGSAARMFADYNMRAQPAGLNGDGLDFNAGYRRVKTFAMPSNMYDDLKWYFHAAEFGSRDKADVAIAGKSTASGGVYYRTGWAGPGPQQLGRQSSSAKIADSYPVYFDIPSERPVSLGALRHAPVLDDAYAPTYSVGTSYAPAFRQDVSRGGLHVFSGDGDRSSFLAATDPLYRLNQALWDSFFFSSATPAALADWSEQTVLPNSRLVYHFGSRTPAAALIGDYDKAAAHLMVNGAFNVNSASVMAWRSLLSGLRDSLADYYAEDDLAGATAYSRYSRQLLDKSLGKTRVYRTGDGGSMSSDDIGTGSRQLLWNGIRMLTDAEIDTLATNIVTRLLAWGQATGRPLLSLGEFVNRHPSAFASGSALDPALGLKGLLQYAIDDGPYAADAHDKALERWEDGINGDVVRNDRWGTSSGLVVDSPEHVAYPNGLHEREARSADAPAFLSQGDILAALAPLLSARSDTFIIRAYGDAVNPRNPAGAPLARAWCEAVVQRVPEPVVRLSSDPDSAGYNEPSLATADTLGRRFEVIAFRWLSEDER